MTRYDVKRQYLSGPLNRYSIEHRGEGMATIVAYTVTLWGARRVAKRRARYDEKRGEIICSYEVRS